MSTKKKQTVSITDDYDSNDWSWSASCPYTPDAKIKHYEDVYYDFGYGDDYKVQKSYTYDGNPYTFDSLWDTYLRRDSEGDVFDVNEEAHTATALVLFECGDLVRTRKFTYSAAGANLGGTLTIPSSSSDDIGLIVSIDGPNGTAAVLDGKSGIKKNFKFWELELVRNDTK